MSAVWWASPAALSLLVLVLQNSILVVMTRYSRVSVPPEKRYHASTLVLNQEILKMFFCLVIFVVENHFCNRVPLLDARGASTVTPGVLTLLRRAIFQGETLKLSVPAALFTMQNYLIFFGLSNLDAVSFQVWSQTKLVSAAVFSVILLKRRLRVMQWVSLFLLTFGVLLTQLQETSAEKRLPTEGRTQRPLLGVASCVLSGLSSSYAGVYFEKVVKTTPPSLAVRNIHLSVFGIPFAVLSMFVLDILPSWKTKKGQEFYFWRGYNQWLTIGLVFIHAFGGLLVAIVVKYADNIVKGFATGVAVAVSGVMSFVIWGLVPSNMFVWGCCLITVATVIYHRHEERVPTE
ncbi:UDP-galactose transporter [Trypanosoma conorhini]|uniref:UDP-galactose transporter n=1 Tax=Trypanosoma conorhini TaxID=83891 RepID=A0A422NVP4_9TRYP|nr:UDP-galactose transporter [Trypanosoma conorhini]RNF09535.1 UDP-galactose transporter [Trypanosoma conorhini]